MNKSIEIFINEEYLKEILDINKECENKVNILIKTKKETQALEVINKCKNLSKDILKTKYRLERKFKLLDILETASYLINNTDDLELMVDIGDSYLDNGYNHIAATIYSRIIANNSDFYLAYYKLAMLLNKTNGNIDLKKKYLLKSIEKKDDFLEARINLLYVYSDLGDYEALERDIKYIKENINENICELILHFFRDMESDTCKDMIKNGSKNEDLFILSTLYEQQLYNTYKDKADETLQRLKKVINKVKKSKIKDKKLLRKMNEFDNIVTFHSTGRGGSFFFHSLIDGHKEVATIPGVYFKGFFSQEVFRQFLSNSNKDFVAKFMIMYEAVFDANCLKSVPGDPMTGKGSGSLAITSGLTTLGENRDTVLKVDKDKFAKKLVKYLDSFYGINEKELFKLVHIVWEEVIRGANLKDKKVLFYHIHNPNAIEYTRYYNLFEKSKALFVIRNWLQGLESWMYTAKVSQNLESLSEADRVAKFRLQYRQMITKAYDRFFSLRSKIYMTNSVAFIKLEDIKNTPKETMQGVSKWMGIEYDDSLLKSEFLGLKFHSNSSKLNKTISEFDKSAIKRKVGVLFSHNDCVLLNTIMTPWNETFEYDEGEFKSVSIEEALVMNDNIMDWERELIDYFNISEEEALKSIKYRKQKFALALNTQEQVYEELKKVTLIKPEL